MVIYTIEVNGELKFVESDPEVVKRVVENEISIDLAKEFADKVNNDGYVEYTVHVNSWCV